eukprot:g3616.t1
MRTLTLTALLAAGLLRLDAATAFQFPLGARSRQAAPPAGNLHPAPVSARPTLGPLGMTVAPEGLDSLGKTEEPGVAAAAAAAAATGDGEAAEAEAGKGGEAAEDGDSGSVASASASAVAAAAPPAPAEPEAVDESNFTELEKAFAEARRRSLAQGVVAKKAPAPVSEEPASGDAAEKGKAVASNTSAAAAPKAQKPAPAKPAAAKAPAKPSASSVPPGTVEGAKLRTTAGQTKAPPIVKGSPPKEAKVVKVKSTPKALRDELKTTPEVAAEPETPAKKAPAPKKAAPAPAAEKSGGAFSLGAESLEEFFGLTKKPRLVSTTTPPSDEPEPTPMAELDASAVETMIADNGLNEVTLKENFRQMEADAKAAQASGTAPAAAAKPKPPPKATKKKPAVKTDAGDGDALNVPVEEAKRIAAAKAKDAVALKPNAVVDLLSSAFNFDKFDPEDKPGPPIAGKTATELRAAVPKVDTKKEAKAAPRAVAAPKPKAAAAPKQPKAAAAPTPKAAAEEKEEGGLAGMLSGMFGAPVYDDEVNTLPEKVSGAPRAMPVFSPPPAPAKAPAPTPKAAASPAPAVKKETAAAATPSFLDGLFAGGDKKASPPPKPKAAAPKAAAPKAAAPKVAAVPEKKKAAPAPAPAGGMFDFLGGGGAASKKAAPPAPAPAPAPEPVKAASSSPFSLFGGAKKAAPAPGPKKPAALKTPAPAPVKAKSPPSPSMFGGVFGGDKKKAEPKKAATPPPPAPAPAPAPKPPASAFSMFGMGGSAAADAKKSSPPKPKSPVKKAPVKKAPVKRVAPAARVKAAVPEKKKAAPAPAPAAGGMFDFLGGASKKAAPPAPAPAPEPVKASSSGGNPFSSLFGGAGESGASGKKKPKRQPAPAPAPAPSPIVSRVKTMDDSFLRKVSVMLRRNQAKIKKFQQLTDRFRGGLIKAPAYYEGVEELFGEDNVDEIIGPLLAALPENDKRKTLQAVYSKAQRAKNGQGEPEGGIAGLFGGWGGKSKSKPTGDKDKPAPASTAAKKGKAAPAARGKKGAAAAAATAAAADPYAFAAAKLSDKDYQVFKTRTALYARGGINARNYYDTLAKVFGEKGVSAQLPALLKALPQNKRKLLQDVVSGLSKN